MTSRRYSDSDDNYGKSRYSFDAVGTSELGMLGKGDVAYLRVADRKYIEIGYEDGRAVRYLYNRSISEV